MNTPIQLVYKLKKIIKEISLNDLYNYTINDIDPFSTGTLSNYAKVSAPAYITATHCTNYRAQENISTYTNYLYFDLDINDERIDKKNVSEIQLKEIDHDHLIMRNYILCAYICFIKKSYSRTGLHLIGYITPDKYTIKSTEKYAELKKRIDSIFNYSFDMLQKKGLIKYKYKIDIAGEKDPVHLTFMTHDPSAYISDSTLDEMDIDDIINGINDTINTYDDQKEKINIDIKKVNEKYYSRLIDILKNEKSDDFIKLNNFLSEKDWSYGSGELYFLYKNLDKEQRITLYKLWNKYEKREGCTFRKYNDINEFNNYIDNNFKLNKDKNQFTFSGFFLNSNIKGLDRDIYSIYVPNFDEDFLRIKYDHTIKVDKYLVESTELKDIIDKNNVLIKAPAGCGKTTYIINYIKGLNINKKEPLNILFMGFKNSLTHKLYRDVNRELSDEFMIHQNYGEYNISCSITRHNIYVSSVQGLNKLRDWRGAPILFNYIIVDEAHILADFSSFIDKDIYDTLYHILYKNDPKLIFLSATPHFISAAKDVLNLKYINIQQHTQKKDKVQFIYTARPMMEVQRLLNKKKDDYDIKIVYKNDKTFINNLVFELQNGGYGEPIQVVSSERKEEEENQLIINNERVATGVTLLTTSWMQEGINLYNDEKTLLIFNLNNIYGNSTDIKDIYQFINRFRKKDEYNNLDIFLISTFPINTIKKNLIELEQRKDIYYKKIIDSPHLKDKYLNKIVNINDKIDTLTIDKEEVDELYISNFLSIYKKTLREFKYYEKTKNGKDEKIKRLFNHIFFSENNVNIFSICNHIREEFLDRIFNNFNYNVAYIREFFDFKTNYIKYKDDQKNEPFIIKLFNIKKLKETYSLYMLIIDHILNEKNEFNYELIKRYTFSFFDSLMILFNLNNDHKYNDINKFRYDFSYDGSYRIFQRLKNIDIDTIKKISKLIYNNDEYILNYINDIKLDQYGDIEYEPPINDTVAPTFYIFLNENQREFTLIYKQKKELNNLIEYRINNHLNADIDHDIVYNRSLTFKVSLIIYKYKTIMEIDDSKLEKSDLEIKKKIYNIREYLNSKEVDLDEFKNIMEVNNIFLDQLRLPEKIKIICNIMNINIKRKQDNYVRKTYYSLKK